jgi:hypothetical protein
MRTTCCRRSCFAPRDEEAAAPPPPPVAVAADAPVDDMLALLARQQPEQRIMPAKEVVVDEVRAPVGLASGVKASSLSAEGTTIVRRSGRLVKTGEGWSFLPESDHPDRVEPPLKVLPCLSVEWMVRETEQDPTGRVYLVTGELTLFMGENYLLPKSVLRRSDAGNLTR